MANFVHHTLSCEGIKQKLIDSGVVYEKTLKSKSAPKGRAYPFVLDYAKCDEVEWAKEIRNILERGVINCAIKGPDGRYGVRRDYTEDEKSELGFYPVKFSEDGNEMTWLCRWIENEDVAFYASKALPEETMILEESYEGTYDGGCYLKNGVNIGEYKPKIREDESDEQ